MPHACDACGFHRAHDDDAACDVCRGKTTLPPRTPDTMSDVIAFASPSGRMSKRAKEAAQERIRVALFGPNGLQRPGLPHQPSKAESLRREAARCRDLAARGMRPRAFIKQAERCEREAAALEG
jgi:hypothetical protein